MSMPGGAHSGQDDSTAILRAELERLRGADPFRALAVPPTSEAADVRRAYLGFTKRFHPNRFALEEPATRELANEVFLLIRKAYDVLMDDDKRRAWREKLGVSTAPPRGATPAPGATGRPQTPTPPGATLPSAGQRPSTPIPTRALPSARAATQPASPATASTQPAPGNRPATAPRPETPSQRGMSARPTTPPATADAVQAMLEQARTRPQRFEDAMRLHRKGKHKDAREQLQKIAMEDPQSRRYRVAMHIVWGHEHLEAGHPAEARSEFDRALVLEPENEDAKKGLAKAKEADKKPGILGKLFGR